MGRFSFLPATTHPRQPTPPPLSHCSPGSLLLFPHGATAGVISKQIHKNMICNDSSLKLFVVLKLLNLNSLESDFCLILWNNSFTPFSHI